jgi:hypothetical protein
MNADLKLKLNDALEPFMGGALNSKHNVQYPDRDNLPPTALRTMKAYCNAACRALVRDGQGTDQFTKVVIASKLKEPAVKDLPPDPRLRKLVQQIGAPPPPPTSPPPLHPNPPAPSLTTRLPSPPCLLSPMIVLLAQRASAFPRRSLSCGSALSLTFPIGTATGTDQRHAERSFCHLRHARVRCAPPTHPCFKVSPRF